MRELRFVAQDAEHLVLETADGAERFTLSVDTALRDAVRAASVPGARPGDRAGATEVRISPREIQMRVRAGESAQAVADSVGSSLDSVLRFAAPVLAERTRIADEARRARARRSTTDGDLVVFGEAVDARFAAHGIEPASVSWDAHRRDDGQWGLTARWIGGQDEHSAEWIFHLTSGRMVTPADDTAADLLSDRPIRPVFAPRVAGAKVEAILSLAPPLASGLVAFPAMPDAHTGPLPRIEQVFDQNRADRQLPEAAAPGAPEPVASVPVASVLDSSVLVASVLDSSVLDSSVPAHHSMQPLYPRQDQLDTDVPLPLGLPTPTPTRIDPSLTPARPQARPPMRGRTLRNRGDSDDDKAARAHIPSWDDILLGVRRKQD